MLTFEVPSFNHKEFLGALSVRIEPKLSAWLVDGHIDTAGQKAVAKHMESQTHTV